MRNSPDDAIGAAGNPTPDLQQAWNGGQVRGIKQVRMLGSARAASDPFHQKGALATSAMSMGKIDRSRGSLEARAREAVAHLRGYRVNTAR
jgi:hypothetical protein